jgi:RNA recognition motif-containing protein
MSELKEESDRKHAVDDGKVSKGNRDPENDRSTSTKQELLQTKNARDLHPTPQYNQNNRATSNTLFMTGISQSLSKLHVEKLFGKFGNVRRVDIKTSKTGTIFCFCEMDSMENAQKAMDNLNGRMLLRHRLVVQPAHERTGFSRQTQVSLSHTNPVRERKILERKIEELKERINRSKR